MRIFINSKEFKIEKNGMIDLGKEIKAQSIETVVYGSNDKEIGVSLGGIYYHDGDYDINLEVWIPAEPEED